MKVHGLILGLLLPLPLFAQQQYYGTRLSSLSLSAPESQEDLQVIPLHPGDTLTRENVRDSIRALYETGHYGSIEVDAIPAPDGGTALTFRVRPNFFFSTFRLDPEDLADRPLSAYFRLPFGEKFSTSAVDRIVQDATGLLKAEGYFQASIAPMFEWDEVNHLVFVTLKATAGAKAKVGTVRIRGGEETFPDMELSRSFDLKPGDDFSTSKLDKAVAEVRSKFADLRFVNTQVNSETVYNEANNTVDLDITVQPGQFVLVQTRPIEISKKKLSELVPVYEESSVDPDLIEEGRVQIERYLQQEGYFDATVQSQTITVDPTLENAIQIIYTIMRGVKHDITAVQIEGNQYFETEKIRERIKTKKRELFSHGVFSPEILDEDRRTIEAMYRNAGFEGTVVTATTEDLGHAIIVTFQIQEGTQLLIDSVVLKGNTEIPEQELRSAISLADGDFYSPGVVDQARAVLTHFYYSRGYADVRIERMVDRVGRGMRVTFQIAEGQAFNIGEIFVEGNDLTRDKIIRRNSRLEPYKPYNPENILEAQQRLYATGLFTRVEIVPLDQGLPGIRNVLIQVEDAKPILLTYGAGYHEFERARGSFEISHNNLWGLNRSIGLRVRGSSREDLAQLTFKEPRLFNHAIDGFLSAFAEHTDQPSYTANRIDFSGQILKALTPQRNFLATAGYQTVNLQDIRVNIHANSLPAERGIISIARIGASYIDDHRNNALNPTSGTFSTTTFQVAARPLGSEINFTSLYNQYSTYTPMRSAVLATSVRFGWNQPFGSTTLSGLPPTERYFAGGSTTLRGFGFDEAQPSGGNVLTLGNIEYRFPMRRVPTKILRENLWGALFYDTGNVFPGIGDISLTNLTHTAGFGFRYLTPLGPVRLDFGINLRPHVNGLDEKRLHVFFTLGNPF
jgi:outer membrane protein insertion porin family